MHCTGVVATVRPSPSLVRLHIHMSLRKVRRLNADETRLDETVYPSRPLNASWLTGYRLRAVCMQPVVVQRVQFRRPMPSPVAPSILFYLRASRPFRLRRHRHCRALLAGTLLSTTVRLKRPTLNSILTPGIGYCIDKRGIAEIPREQFPRSVLARMSLNVSRRNRACMTKMLRGC